MPKKQKDESKDFWNNNKEIRKFTKHFFSIIKPEMDLVSMILRGHLFMEHYVDEVLAEQMPRGYILKEKFKYLSQKINILEALDVIPRKYIDSLRRLNTLRGKCAHELKYLEYDVSESDINEIGVPLGKDYRSIKEESLSQERSEEFYKKDLLMKLLSFLVIGLYSKTSDFKNMASRYENK